MSFISVLGLGLLSGLLKMFLFSMASLILKELERRIVYVVLVFRQSQVGFRDVWGRRLKGSRR